MECNSALKRYEVLIHAVIEMNLKNIIILSEKIQTQKRLISFIQCVRIDKSTERESKLVAVQDWEGMRALRNDR